MQTIRCNTRQVKDESHILCEKYADAREELKLNSGYKISWMTPL